ncbi:ArsR family transcriptional regulator [Novimethylophilus kurashikiensis]|uniref:ArsR family transcriptional regulator n=1 Tax=Novimethylophilus kurashikiensis TaxID=1825523 RepID=A0A2R5F8S3_9PROT|nr:metalloregulator ArsR/SmtB family transcription factor [Novimethylophilus kurashikiensis]GBG14597.1 ArsR family transcriptional regulator [Novimethylophilus kurashikiensis]
MNTLYIQHLPEDWQSISAIFVAMGDPQRQRLLLAFEPGERLTAGQLCDASPLNRTTVSHHLKVLRQAGVLNSEKVGKEVFYWVNREAVAAALDNVLAYVKA